MDQEKVYKNALELASTFRYREAQEQLTRIIAERPDNIDALLLLGKVEYYLRQFSSSRKRFETVLTYEPANQAAYFGIEYYRERKKRSAIFIFSILAVILLAASSTILFFSLSSAFERKLSRYENSIQKEIGLLEASLQSLSDTRKKIDEALALHTKELNELKKLLALHIDSSGGYFGYTGRELKKLQEKIESLDNDQAKLLNDYSNLLKLITRYIESGREPADFYLK